MKTTGMGRRVRREGAGAGARATTPGRGGELVRAGFCATGSLGSGGVFWTATSIVAGFGAGGVPGGTAAASATDGGGTAAASATGGGFTKRVRSIGGNSTGGVAAAAPVRAAGE
jgi:hypothetical protein